MRGQQHRHHHQPTSTVAPQGRSCAAPPAYRMATVNTRGSSPAVPRSEHSTRWARAQPASCDASLLRVRLADDAVLRTSTSSPTGSPGCAATPESPAGTAPPLFPAAARRFRDAGFTTADTLALLRINVRTVGATTAASDGRRPHHRRAPASAPTGRLLGRPRRLSGNVGATTPPRSRRSAAPRPPTTPSAGSGGPAGCGRSWSPSPSPGPAPTTATSNASRSPRASSATATAGRSPRRRCSGCTSASAHRLRRQHVGRQRGRAGPLRRHRIRRASPSVSRCSSSTRPALRADGRHPRGGPALPR